MHLYWKLADEAIQPGSGTAFNPWLHAVWKMNDVGARLAQQCPETRFLFDGVWEARDSSGLRKIWGRVSDA